MNKKEWYIIGMLSGIVLIGFSRRNIIVTINRTININSKD